MNNRTFLHLSQLLLLPYIAQAFVVNQSICSSGRHANLPLRALSNAVGTEDVVTLLSRKIEETVSSGKDPEEYIQQLEALNSVKEPNRSSKFLGEWHVWYTNCPPPSNGRLGPFRGTAGQMVVDSRTRSYRNLLSVPPNNWLTAVLDGVWEDWDGKYLDDGMNDPSTTSVDWGACHWKVTFLSLTISIFGLHILNKEFPSNTSRVWRTTYLDDEIRIVRAGKTGRREDEVVFYTRRSPTPGPI